MIPNAAIPGAGFLYGLDLVVTTFSILGSLFMLFLCLRMRRSFTLSLKFILAISIADFFYSLANVMSNFELGSETIGLCIFEAVTRHCSFLLSIFFSTCTAVASYKASLPKQNFNKNSFFILNVTIGTLLCIVTCIAGPSLFPEFLLYVYGPVNCSIGTSSGLSAVSMLTVEMIFRGFPILIGLIVTLFGYLYAIRTLKQISEQFGQKMDMNVYKLLWYPFVSLVIFLPSVLDPIVSIYVTERPVWVRALRIGIPHSIGLTNAVLYIVMRGLYQQPIDEVEPEDQTDTESYCKERTNSIDNALSKALVD